MKTIENRLLSSLSIVGIFFPFLATSAVAANKSNDKPTNIIIIYTDQQRYNTIRALGNNDIDTPNLDYLVKQGISYDHCYVACPVSMPSRWSLHSGMYTSTHGAFSNHHSVAQKPLTSLPEELKKAGYYTSVVGKNHSFLNKQRVDEMVDAPQAKRPEDGRCCFHASPWTYEQDPMHILTDKALKIIEEKSKEHKHVFMWLSYLNPHTPYSCPDPFFSEYNGRKIEPPFVEPQGLAMANKPFRQQFHKINTQYVLNYDYAQTLQMKRVYYGMISLVDAEIGRVIAKLKDLGTFDNTLIVFSSDHGDYMGDHGLYTKSPALYDCLERVPLIFMWKGKILNNKVSKNLISSVDIMPTILDLIGVPIPKQVQGISMKNELIGKKFKKRDYVYAEYGIPGVPFTKEKYDSIAPFLKNKAITFRGAMPWEANPISLAGRIRMICNHNYKFIQEIGGTNEFYDLINDPHELVNLYGNKKYLSVISTMEKDLNKWKNSIPMVMSDTVKLGKKDLDNYIKHLK